MNAELVEDGENSYLLHRLQCAGQCSMRRDVAQFDVVLGKFAQTKFRLLNGTMAESSHSTASLKKESFIIILTLTNKILSIILLETIRTVTFYKLHVTVSCSLHSTMYSNIYRPLTWRISYKSKNIIIKYQHLFYC